MHGGLSPASRAIQSIYFIASRSFHCSGHILRLIVNVVVLRGIVSQPIIIFVKILKWINLTASYWLLWLSRFVYDCVFCFRHEELMVILNQHHWFLGHSRGFLRGLQFEFSIEIVHASLITYCCNVLIKLPVLESVFLINPVLDESLAHYINQFFWQCLEECLEATYHKIFIFRLKNLLGNCVGRIAKLILFCHFS